MDNKVNAGVIGAGHMGQYHMGAYSEINSVNLVGVADIDESRAATVGEKHNVSHYTDYKQLLDSLDVVSIAVPTSAHFDVAKDCLEAGVHCLVEKPICDSLEKAEKLFEIAEKNNVVLHVGHVERFNGAVQQLSAVVCDPILIESRRLGPYNSRIKDGVVLDLMIHDIDIVMNIVKSPVAELNVLGSSVFTDQEDVVNVQILFENGCLANIIASRATQEKIRTLAVTQEKEYIVLNYTNQDILVHRLASSQSELTRKELQYRQESFIERIYVHRENPLKLQLLHLIGCSTNGESRMISVENELKSLKVALQVLDKLTPVNHKISQS